MRAHPVSKHVNKPAHDDPACIEPVKRVRIVRPGPSPEPDDDDPTQETLF
jgi:hypothetical protein